MVKSSKYSNPEVLARITRLGLRASRAVEGTIAGLHRSPYQGRSVEFVDYREYAPGDDLKRLDWRVYARTGRHYVRRYEEESNLRGTILLDASASMRYGRGAMTKYDYAATLAASVATLLIRQRDAAGLALFDEQRRSFLPPSATQTQLSKIIEELEGSQPDRTTSLGEVIQQVSDEIPGRGLVCIISDFLTDLDVLQDGLNRLHFRGHEILAFHVLDRDELELPFQGSVNFRDLEGSEELMAEPHYFRLAYQEAMKEFCRDLTRRFRGTGVDLLALTTDTDLGLALSHFLHRRQALKRPGAARTRRGG